MQQNNDHDYEDSTIQVSTRDGAQVFPNVCSDLAGIGGH